MKTRNLLMAASAAVVFLAAPVALQAAPAAGGEGPIVHKKTLWETLKEGGWVMVPLAMCSVLTLYLIGDGVMKTNRKKAIPPEHEATIKDLFRAGDYVGAYNYARDNPSPFNNVVRAGVGYLGDGKQLVEEAIFSELNKENSKMQSWISYLSVIGVCTPMIGLLGTVTGMIKAFETLGAAGIGDPSALSAAIGEVLVATASGLAIAIPAFGAFYYLRNRANKMLHDIQAIVSSLLRKMPYEAFAGVHIGDEELFAADPNWLQQQPAEGEEAVA